MRKKRFIVLASCGFLGLHAVIYNGSKQASKQASMKADIVVLWLVPAFWPASSGRAGPGRAAAPIYLMNPVPQFMLRQCARGAYSQLLTTNLLSS